MISDKEIVLKLLAHVLIEIREEAHEIKNKKIFALADLVHNLPYSINAKLKEDEAFALILTEREERAEIKGLSNWLEKKCAGLKEKGSKNCGPPDLRHRAVGRK